MNTEFVETKTRDWDFLFTGSEYIVISELINLYEEGNTKEVLSVMKRYKEKIKKSEERELRWKLEELMECILLWKSTDKYKNPDHEIKILDLRSDIDMALQLEGCLTTDTIKKVWHKAFEEAKEDAAIFEKKIINCNELTWDEVFNQDY